MNDARRVNPVTLLAALVALLPAASADTAFSSPVSSWHRGAESARALAADSTDDGPHVFWESDTTAIAFYLCGGEVVTKRFYVTDTLRFRGFCGDSALSYVMAARKPDVAPYLFDHIPRILAISDIHGEYEALIVFLQNAGVIDEELHWVWGDGHLVVDGDTFDRGDKVTECLWLFHRLEREALQKGGRVHFLLGNHETMAFQGDIRYVNRKYLDGIVRKTKITYEDLYGPDMEMGRWLRSKHAVIRLNGILFVHGGIPPWYVERGRSLEKINEMTRANLDLESYALAFNDSLEAFFGAKGPFWYRGYHYGQDGRYPKATQQDVDVTLAAYRATAIVVGHTEIDRVTALYGGRVFGIDVPLEKLGAYEGLLWENRSFFRVTGSGDLEPLP